VPAALAHRDSSQPYFSQNATQKALAKKDND